MPTSGIFAGGCVTLLFSCILCSAAGVGGGGINVPILLLIFGYGFNTSVKLSLFAVLGNALAQNILNFGKSHPKYNDLPLIFWELVIILSPAQLGGSNIGNILADILPDSVLYIIALLILLFACYMSTKKGIKRYHEEVEIDKAKQSLTSISTTPNPSLPPTKEEGPHDRNSVSSIDEVDRRTSIAEELNNSKIALGTLAKALNQKTDLPAPIQLPLRVMLVVFIVWVCYTAIVVSLKFVSKCSTDYYLLFIFLYVPLVGGDVWGLYNASKLGEIFRGSIHADSSFEVRTRSSQVDEEAKRTKREDDEDTEKIDDSKKKMREALLSHDEENQGTIVRENSLKLGILTFLIGIICSLLGKSYLITFIIHLIIFVFPVVLGIGGGELLSPMMLTFHILPQVTSATSAMMSLINTSAQVIRALATSSGIWSAGIILFIIGFIGGFVGRKIGLIISYEYNRSSFIIFSLVAVLSISSLYYIVELAIMDFNVEVDSVC